MYISRKVNVVEGLTVGRIVHYVEGTPNGAVHLAAIVTKVWDKESGVVNLAIFSDWSDVYQEIVIPQDDGLDYKLQVVINGETSVLYDENKGLSTWHWIERA